MKNLSLKLLISTILASSLIANEAFANNSNAYDPVSMLIKKQDRSQNYPYSIDDAYSENSQNKGYDPIDNSAPSYDQEKSEKEQEANQKTDFLPYILIGTALAGIAAALSLSSDDNNSSSSSTPDPDNGDTDTGNGDDSDNNSGNDDDTGSGNGNGSDTDNNDQTATFETEEYNRDYTLSMINASSRYADGGTGQGEILAVADTGTDITHSEFDQKITYTWDYSTNSSNMSDANGHGTWVASKIGARKDDVGMQGVAYDADLAIFKIFPDDSSTAVDISYALADAYDKSIDLGAIAINHSWVMTDPNGGDAELLITDFTRDSLAQYLGTEIMNAFAAADTAGMISVFAAGNTSQDEISALAGLPVLYPEFADSIIGVVAVDENGEIASFSNRCGSAKDFCIAAPGVSVLGAASSDAVSSTGVQYGEDEYTYSSGTSMAAPVVTGAIGVLASNFPELTSAEILQVIKDTATDLGQEGVDEVYGNGLLNLKNAVAPQGTITVMSGTDISQGSIPLSKSWIAGDNVITSSLASSLTNTSMMVTDKYDRGYSVKISSLVSKSKNSISDISTDIARFTAAPANIDLSNESTGFDILPSGVSTKLSNNWSNAGAFSSPYARLVDSPVVSYTAKTDAFEMTVYGAVDKEGSNYASLEIGTSTDKPLDMSVELGQLYENDQMLGTHITGAFGQNLSTKTHFAKVNTNLEFSSDLGMVATASLGVTDFQSNGIFQSGSNITTSSYGVGLYKNNLFQPNDTISFGLSRPMSINQGQISLDLPIAMSAAENDVRTSSVSRSKQKISMNQSDTTADIQLGYSSLIGKGRLSIGGAYRYNASTQDEMTMAAGLTFSF